MNDSYSHARYFSGFIAVEGPGAETEARDALRRRCVVAVGEYLGVWVDAGHEYHVFARTAANTDRIADRLRDIGWQQIVEVIRPTRTGESPATDPFTSPPPYVGQVDQAIERLGQLVEQTTRLADAFALFEASQRARAATRGVQHLCTECSGIWPTEADVLLAHRDSGHDYQPPRKQP